MERPDPTLVLALEGFSAGVAALVIAYGTGQMSRADAFEALGDLFETLIPATSPHDRTETTPADQPTP